MILYRSALYHAIKRQISSPNVRHCSQSSEKWDLLCGVCLERRPVITRPLNELERSFSKMLLQFELEKSQQSEHEIRRKVDEKRAVEFKKGKISTEDLDKAVGQTAAEFEDVSAKELQAFQPAPKTTEADEKNDVKSTDRKLDQHLLFVMEEKVGGDRYWLLPQDLVRAEETLKQAAERILSEKCGSKIQVKFYGNAPCGFYKYKYPKNLRRKVMGAKIFFMKAQYLKGSVDENLIDYNWVTRDELTSRFPSQYLKAVSSFLVDDEPVELKTS